MGKFINNCINNPNHTKTIKILSWVAFILMFVGRISYFLKYDNDFNLKFQFPGVLIFISFLLELAPSILLILYTLNSKNYLKSKWFLPAIFAVLAIGPLYLHVSLFISYAYLSTLIELAPVLLLIILFIICTINTSKGTINNKLVIFTIAVATIKELLTLVIVVPRLIMGPLVNPKALGYFQSDFLSFANIIGTIIVYAVLLILCLKIRANTIANNNKEQTTI